MKLIILHALRKMKMEYEQIAIAIETNSEVEELSQDYKITLDERAICARDFSNQLQDLIECIEDIQ